VVSFTLWPLHPEGYCCYSLEGWPVSRAAWEVVAGADQLVQRALFERM